MSTFTLSPADTDDISGVTAENNLYYFSPATLCPTDVVTGGATGPFVDILVLTASGTVVAEQFAQVTDVEQLYLSADGNNVTLTGGLVSGASTAYFIVVDGNGDDNVDATDAARAIAFIASGGNDKFSGGSANDVFAFAATDLSAADKIIGGAGFDRLQITTGGTVGAAAFAQISGVDALVLSDAGNDVALSNSLVAGSENNYFIVADGAGDDTIDASGVTSGRPVIFHASIGNDTLKGSTGTDFFYFSSNDLTSGDTVVGGTGNDVLVFDDAGTVSASAFANVSGIELLYLSTTGGNVTLTDALAASSDIGVLGIIDLGGNDVVDGSLVTGGTGLQFYAGAGDDSFTGGSGSDVVIVTAADLTSADTLDGGAGLDYLVVGGTGALAATALDNVTGFEVLYLGSGIGATLNNSFVAGSSFGKMTVMATGGSTADASGATNGIEVDFYAGGGNNTLKGGTGNDFLFTPNFQSTDDFDGGAGNDYIFLTQNGENLDITANRAHIHNTEVVWLDGANNNTVTLDAADIPVISGTGYLYIVAGSDDQANVGGTGWTLLETNHTNNAIAPGHTFTHYHNTNGADLYVDSLIAFTVALDPDPWTADPNDPNPPTILLGGLDDGPNFSASCTLGDLDGAAIADTDLFFDDADVVDSHGVSAHIVDMLVQITNPLSGSLEHLDLTADGHTILTANGLAISGEGTSSVHITGSADDTVYRSLLLDLRYVNTDVSGVTAPDRMLTVDASDGAGLAAMQRTTTITLTEAVGLGGPSANGTDEPDFETWPAAPANQVPIFTHTGDEPISLDFDSEAGSVKPFAAISGAVDDPENGSIQSLVLSVSHSPAIDAASAFSMSFDHGFGHLGLTDLGAQIAADAGLTVTGAGTQSLAIVGFADETQMSQILAEVIYGTGNVPTSSTDFVSAFATDDAGLTSDSLIIAMHLHSQGMLLQ